MVSPQLIVMPQQSLRAFSLVGWKFVKQSINRGQKTNKLWVHNINCKVENMHMSLDLSTHEFKNEEGFAMELCFWYATPL